MNFLLHHALARRHIGTDASALGAMLPDVWRMADRRAHVRDVPDASDDDTVRALLAGVAHHVAADARFHVAPVFTIGEARTRAALRAASDAPKLALFAHIAWELCLDGALVRREGVDHILASLGSSVRRVRPNAHHRAALAAVPSLRGGAPERRVLFERRVDQIFDAIALGPWIAGYATGGGIAERLEGVRSRLGLAPLDANDRNAVGRSLDTLAASADEAVDEILGWESTAASPNLTGG